jgi:hypothetical protein
LLLHIKLKKGIIICKPLQVKETWKLQL